MIIAYDPDLDGAVSAALIFRRHGLKGKLVPLGVTSVEEVLHRAPVGSTIYILDHAYRIELNPMLRSKVQSLNIILIDHHIGNPLAKIARESYVITAPSTASIVLAFTGYDGYWRSLVDIVNYADLMKCNELSGRRRLACWRLSIAVASMSGSRLNRFVRCLAERNGRFRGCIPDYRRLVGNVVSTLEFVRDREFARCGGIVFTDISGYGGRLNKIAIYLYARRYPCYVIMAKKTVRLIGNDKELIRKVARLIARRLGGTVFGRVAKSVYFNNGVPREDIVGVVCEWYESSSGGRKDSNHHRSHSKVSVGAELPGIQ